MSRPQRHVLLVFGSPIGSGTPTGLSTESSVLSRLLDDPTVETTVSVLSWGAIRPIPGIRESVSLDPADQGTADRVLSALGCSALHRRLSRIPVGRALNSIGPCDPARVFWRAVRRSAEAGALVDHADVIIAADSAAILAAWRWRRRGRTAEAHFDHRAASIATVVR